MINHNVSRLSLDDEDEDRFERMLGAMAGTLVPEASRASTTRRTRRQLAHDVELLEERVSRLEAELALSRRSRALACPRCRQRSLNVIATQPHPEFPDEGIELQEIRCDRCGHHGHRLHDPSGFIF